MWIHIKWSYFLRFLLLLKLFQIEKSQWRKEKSESAYSRKKKYRYLIIKTHLKVFHEQKIHMDTRRQAMIAYGKHMDSWIYGFCCLRTTLGKKKFNHQKKNNLLFEDHTSEVLCVNENVDLSQTIFKTVEVNLRLNIIPILLLVHTFNFHAKVLSPQKSSKTLTSLFKILRVTLLGSIWNIVSVFNRPGLKPRRRK